MKNTRKKKITFDRELTSELYISYFLSLFFGWFLHIDERKLKMVSEYLYEVYINIIWNPFLPLFILQLRFWKCWFSRATIESIGAKMQLNKNALPIQIYVSKTLSDS